MTVAQYCRWWRDHVRRREGQAAPEPQLDGSAHARAGTQGAAARAPVSASADAAPTCGARADDQQDAAGPSLSLDGAVEPGRTPPLWYLKDWHFTTDFPGYQAGSDAIVAAGNVRCVLHGSKSICWCTCLCSSGVGGARPQPFSLNRLDSAM